ncbi:MAG: hypothetical protein K2K92_05320 [Duncaniella sp.]|nr:hypothetical protein [Duncaniella sp.]
MSPVLSLPISNQQADSVNLYDEEIGYLPEFGRVGDPDDFLTALLDDFVSCLLSPSDAADE